MAPQGTSFTTTAIEGTFLVKAGLAKMLKGGVVMDAVNVEQARIVEEAEKASKSSAKRTPKGSPVKKKQGASTPAVGTNDSAPNSSASDVFFSSRKLANEYDAELEIEMKTYGNYLKDLNVLGRNFATVLLVDNSPHAFGYQINNGVPIGGPARAAELVKAIESKWTHR